MMVEIYGVFGGSQPIHQSLIHQQLSLAVQSSQSIIVYSDKIL